MRLPFCTRQSMFVVPRVFLACFVTALLLRPPLILAQTAASPRTDGSAALSIDSLGVAQYYTVENDGVEIKNGLIVSHRFSHYAISNETYDKNMFGVISLEPAVSFTNAATTADSYPVLTNGTALVQVSGHNGPIKKGDRLTSSEFPGIAMKAGQSGFTLGVAKADYAPTNKDSVDTIPVDIEIKFTFAEDSPESEKISTRLKDLVSLSAIAAIESPKQALQYVVASLCLLGSLGFAIFSFIRAAHKGIDALGRNPLAKVSISLGIFINSIISILIAATGLAGAYFMLTM